VAAAPISPPPPKKPNSSVTLRAVFALDYDGPGRRRRDGQDTASTRDDGQMNFDPREFRNTLGRFATGVTIITTVSDTGELFGVTANSFSSLSLDPPLVLFCLDVKALSFDAFSDATHFNINILAEEQEELSGLFAKSGTDKWNGVRYETSGSGCPILPDCISTLECRTRDIHEGGDHVIIVGEVEGFRNNLGDRRPLLFFQGRYNALSD
jgi:flavin reductase (DIM6/NTAB) family NADH-FMN oxidoreductase RutF